MFYLMGYDKDNDIYDELYHGTKEQMLQIAENMKDGLNKDRYISSYGEPYDWLEIWDAYDDCGRDDIYICKG